MKAVYVITTPDRLPKNMFKVGRTSQDEHGLRRRYLTGLIQPITLAYLPVEDEVEAEKSLHHALEQYRIEQSEWFHCDLSIIMNHLSNLPLKKSNDVYMEDDSRLFQWLTKETSLKDFIIVQKNPLVGYYRPLINDQTQNYWLPFPAKGREGFLELLRLHVKREAPFWLEKQQHSKIMEEISPLDMLMKSQASSVYRTRLHFREVNRAFLDFCMDCILSLCEKQLSMKTRFSTFSSKGKEEKGIIYLDQSKKMMAKFFSLASNEVWEQRERNLEETKRVVFYHNEHIPLCEPPPPSLKWKEEFEHFMRIWIPDEQDRENFRAFGKNCFLDVRGRNLFQKSTISETDSELFNHYLPSSSIKSNYDGLQLEHCSDHTLVSEYLATVIDYFYPKSFVRLFGHDAYSWENVNSALKDVSCYTSTFPKIVIIYSSVLYWKTEMAFKNIEVPVTQWYADHLKDEQIVKGIPNYVIVSPENMFGNMFGRSSHLASPLTKEIERFQLENPTFFEHLTSSEMMWTALHWFFIF